MGTTDSPDLVDAIARAQIPNARVIPTRFERWTSRWRALPNLLVIGAQKSGTTSLHDCLARHSEIRMSRIKECQVLWRDSWSLREYRAYFPPRSRCLFPQVKCVGESTPFYLFHPNAASAAVRLNAALAREKRALRAIVVLRDPVERAWSHYQHARRHGFETLPLDEALRMEEQRIRQSVYSFQHHSYQSRGIYAPQLERWFAAIGRERVLVLEFGELLEWREATRERLRVFLELDHAFVGELPNANAGRGEKLPAETRAQLARFFEAPNRALERLLGRQLRWMKPPSDGDA